MGFEQRLAVSQRYENRAIFFPVRYIVHLNLGVILTVTSIVSRSDEPYAVCEAGDR